MNHEAAFLMIGLIAGAAGAAVPLIIIANMRVKGIRSTAASAVSGDLRVLQEQRAAAESDRDRLRAELQAVQTKLTDVSAAASAHESGCKSRDQQIAVLREDLAARERRISDLTDRIAGLERTAGELKTRLDAERTQADDKIRLLTETRDQLKTEFQNLANNIFDEKTKKFTEQNKSNLDLVLEPLRSQLGEFRKRVDDVHVSESKDRQALFEQIKSLSDLNRQVGKEADNLTRALKGESKTQGNWGELVLERALELSGLQKDVEYHVQSSHVDEGGNRQQPDVVVHLPEGRDVIVDSKVSLTAYEAAVNAATDEERDGLLGGHLASIRTHIDQLSGKSYEALPDIRTLDYVLMFMPVEAAFVAAIRRDPGIFEYAYRKRVILVSPSTLLVTLRTIQNMWQSEHQNRNAQEIARKAADLYDKFAGFADTLTEVRKAIGQASDRCDQAMSQLSTGKGSITRRIEAFRAMGVKPKKELPDGMAGEGEEDQRPETRDQRSAVSGQQPAGT